MAALSAAEKILNSCPIDLNKEGKLTSVAFFNFFRANVMMFCAATLFSLSPGKWWGKETQPKGGLIHLPLIWSMSFEHHLETRFGQQVLSPHAKCALRTLQEHQILQPWAKVKLEVTI